MDTRSILAKHCAHELGPEHFKQLLEHSQAVAQKAIKIARCVAHLLPDLEFIEEAALLHDIGIIHTHAPKLGCHGSLPYICHGYKGREMLEQEGLPRHALVCENHVGAGLLAGEIVANGLPLPARDMMPQSIEEIIVCVADKFFSKNGTPMKEKSIEQVRAEIGRYGAANLARFNEWARMLNIGGL